MDGEITVQDIYDAMSPEKKKLLHLLVGVASESKIYDTFTGVEKEVTEYLMNRAKEANV